MREREDLVGWMQLGLAFIATTFLPLWVLCVAVIVVLDSQLADPGAPPAAPTGPSPSASARSMLEEVTARDPVGDAMFPGALAALALSALLLPLGAGLTAARRAARVDALLEAPDVLGDGVLTVRVTSDGPEAAPQEAPPSTVVTVAEPPRAEASPAPADAAETDLDALFSPRGDGARDRRGEGG